MRTGSLWFVPKCTQPLQFDEMVNFRTHQVLDGQFECARSVLVATAASVASKQERRESDALGTLNGVTPEALDARHALTQLQAYPRPLQAGARQTAWAALRPAQSSSLSPAH